MHSLHWYQVCQFVIILVQLLLLACFKLELWLAGMIARDLDLMRGGKRYIKTAAYGHFGRDDPDFTWEKVKKLEA